MAEIAHLANPLSLFADYWGRYNHFQTHLRFLKVGLFQGDWKVCQNDRNCPPLVVVVEITLDEKFRAILVSTVRNGKNHELRLLY